jgi:hypothetical protein
MTFGDYKSRDSALKAFHLDSRSEVFIEPVAHTVPAFIRERLFLVGRTGFVRTEAGVAEGLIFPILLEAWMPYTDAVQVWRQPQFGTEDLQGFPDYVITRIPHTGYMLFEQPYCCVVEAKQEKFDEGWGQCLAAMVACQRLNGEAWPVFGAVTVGSVWQFGRLDGTLFTLDAQPFASADLDRLVGALRFLFEEIRKVPPLPPPAARLSA